MSAVDFLSHDHQRLDDLVAEVTDPSTDHRVALDRLNRKLAAHVSVERSLVYPVVKQRGLGPDDLPDKIVEDHHEIQRLMVRIERRKVNSPDLPALVTELIDVMRAHRARCADTLIPALQERLSAEELDDLGEQMDQAESVILSHPHPHLLSLGPLSRLTTRIAARFDRLRDRTVSNG